MKNGKRKKKNMKKKLGKHLRKILLENLSEVLQPLIKPSESVALDQLETPEAKAIYKILDLIIKELPPDPALDLLMPLLELSKQVCPQIDKEPETRKKASDFLNQLQHIHKKWVTDSWENLERETSASH